jgi:hypothetical protein
LVIPPPDTESGMYGITSSAVSLIRAGITEEFRPVPEG